MKRDFLIVIVTAIVVAIATWFTTSALTKSYIEYNREAESAMMHKIRFTEWEMLFAGQEPKAYYWEVFNRVYNETHDSELAKQTALAETYKKATEICEDWVDQLLRLWY